MSEWKLALIVVVYTVLTALVVGIMCLLRNSLYGVLQVIPLLVIWPVFQYFLTSKRREELLAFALYNIKNSVSEAASIISTDGRKQTVVFGDGYQVKVKLRKVNGKIVVEDIQ